MIEIDETKLPENLFVTTEDGKKSLDFSKIKTIEDVNNALNAKEHVKTEFSQFKEKYKNIDLEKYNSLINQEFEANKDVLGNPVYKNLEGQYNSLKSQFSDLQQQIAKRDQDIFDSELKDTFRKFKGVEESAIDDILYRAKIAGFSKTEKGILNKEGSTLNDFMENLKTNAPHLFKRTIGMNNSYEKMAAASKNGDIAAAIKALYE